MKVIGLTGGIGMGKSTADKILRERGVPVVDTDIIARRLVEPDQPAFKKIKNTFGADIVGGDGRLRRDELARIVFADDAKRKQLESILHPLIRETWLEEIARWRHQGKPLAVVVIPLLLETNAQENFDAIICAACSATTQHRRLLERGWSPEQITQRNAAQWPVEQKMSRSDFVVWTEGSIQVDAQQLEKILNLIA